MKDGVAKESEGSGETFAGTWTPDFSRISFDEATGELHLVAKRTATDSYLGEFAPGTEWPDALRTPEFESASVLSFADEKPAEEETTNEGDDTAVEGDDTAVEGDDTATEGDDTAVEGDDTAVEGDDAEGDDAEVDDAEDDDDEEDAG